MDLLNFSLKYAIGCPPCINTTPIPTPEASHSSLKFLEKTGKTRMGACVNLSSNVSKVFSCFSPQAKLHPS